MRGPLWISNVPLNTVYFGRSFLWCVGKPSLCVIEPGDWRWWWRRRSSFPRPWRCKGALAEALWGRPWRWRSAWWTLVVDKPLWTCNGKLWERPDVITIRVIVFAASGRITHELHAHRMHHSVYVGCLDYKTSPSLNCNVCLKLKGLFRLCCIYYNT